MEWIIENWFWVVFGVAFVFMPLFGFGRYKKQPCLVKHSDHRH